MLMLLTQNLRQAGRGVGYCLDGGRSPGVSLLKALQILLLNKVDFRVWKGESNVSSKQLHFNQTVVVVKISGGNANIQINKSQKPKNFRQTSRGQRVSGGEYVSGRSWHSGGVVRER